MSKQCFNFVKLSGIQAKSGEAQPHGVTSPIRRLQLFNVRTGATCRFSHTIRPPVLHIAFHTRSLLASPSLATAQSCFSALSHQTRYMQTQHFILAYSSSLTPSFNIHVQKLQQYHFTLGSSHLHGVQVCSAARKLLLQIEVLWLVEQPTSTGGGFKLRHLQHHKGQHKQQDAPVLQIARHRSTSLRPCELVILVVLVTGQQSCSQVHCSALPGIHLPW